jgi:type IV secretion system protein VirD4
MTIYLGSDPGDLSLLAPLYNLFFQQIADLHTRETPPRALARFERNRRARQILQEAVGRDTDVRRAARIKAEIIRATGFEPGQRNAVPVLLIVDEFKRLGKMDVLGEGFSYLAGYGVRIAAVFQSPAQIIAVYGAHMAREIEANCGIQIFFTPSTYADAEDISRRLGTQTVKTRSRSDTRTAFFSSSGGNLGNISHSEASRPLLMPSEVEDMPARLGVIFQPGAGRPILHRRIRYFEDRAFRPRAAHGWVVPPVQSTATYTAYVRRQGCHVLSTTEIEDAPLDRVVIGAASAAAFSTIIADAKAHRASAPGCDAAPLLYSPPPARKASSRFSAAIEAAKQRTA